MVQPEGPLHVIGIGCGGSYTVLRLARQLSKELLQLHVWDGDDVEAHNVHSQAYLPKHVRLSKVHALGMLVREWSGVSIVPHYKYIDRTEALSGVVFVAVDTMETRKNLWEHSIRKNPSVSLMIEMRLETAGALIHVVNPCDLKHIRQWERYWYPDEKSTNGGSCGKATSLFPVADFAANLAVTQYLRAVQIARGASDRLDNQIRIELQPLKVETYRW